MGQALLEMLRETEGIDTAPLETYLNKESGR